MTLLVKKKNSMPYRKNFLLSQMQDSDLVASEIWSKHILAILKGSRRLGPTRNYQPSQD
jgi:hypothetical protein